METRCYLDNATDWRVLADLDGRLKVPEDIAVTNLRPDIVLISKSTKNVGIVELTVPSEERVELSGELKRTKYAGLKEEGRKNGWKMQVWAIEVGCRGFPASSMVTFLKEMGFQACEWRGRKGFRSLDRLQKVQAAQFGDGVTLKVGEQIERR